MDPISLAIGAVGLGMQIFGAVKGGNAAADTAAAQSRISKDVATQEQGINEQKQQAMELAGRRQQMEIMRNNQRARAMAIQSATTQGASMGSGLQGGLAEIQDQSLTNLIGVNDALTTGRNIAGYNAKITQDKYAMADVQAQGAKSAADAAVFSSLGGALVKSGPIIGQLSSGFGGGKIGTFSDGGNNGMAPSWA